MKKHVYLFIVLCLLAACLLVGCKSDPTPEETEPATSPDTTDTVSGEPETPAETEKETEVETVPETEPETRPEIKLPTDPAEIVALIDSIPNGNIENEFEIDRAYAAWAALSEADREKVTNYDTLRTRLQELADAHVVKDYRDDRIPHGELVIGVYYPFKSANPSEQEIQDLKDANIKMLFGNPSSSVEYLDMLHANGMGAILGGGFTFWRAPWALEGHGGIPTVTIQQAADSMVQMPDHPAIWGWDLTDEPGSNNFWWIGEAVEVYNNQYFNAQVFANNHPAYGTAGPLGIYAYDKLMRNYVTRIDSELVFFDHYMYQVNGRHGNLIKCLSSGFEACKAYDRDYGVILQLIYGPGMEQAGEINLERFKYQAYASMAFGNKYVIWACYASDWGGGWGGPALDADGNKTPKYYHMKECNNDLTVLSPIYMRYSAQAQTLLSADLPNAELQFLAQTHPIEELGQKTIRDLSIGEQGDVLVSFYEKNVGEGEAFLFLNCADPYFLKPMTSTVTFRPVSGASIVTAYVKGVPTILDPVDGVYTIEVKDADAVFVTVSEPESINAKPVAYPISQLTVAGKDIGEFTVVIPANATKRETQAAEALVSLITKATGKTLPIVTDAETPAAYISLGKTALSAAADNVRSSLKGDGYALLTKDGNLYITGVDADGAGTLMGVYGFCEDYLGYRLYGEKDMIIPTADTKAIPDGLSETHNPAFLHREATFNAAVRQPYPLYQKYNGDLLYGDMDFASEWWAGESLYRLAGAELYEAPMICLSSEEVYATVLANARQMLACDTNAEYLACDISQEKNWRACPCDACAAVTSAEGTPMALLLNFVNRLAADLKADHPHIKVTTMAVDDMIQVPATVRPSDDVIIRLVLPEGACRFHALNDKTCTKNHDFRAALESWTAVSKNVMILDNATKRGEAMLSPGANLLTLYDSFQYLREKGVIGYQHIGYDRQSSEMDPLRNYLLSRLLWDEDMTRDEYLAEMDSFLAYYYGAGWTYVRQYMDKMYNTADTDHATYKQYINMLGRSNDRGKYPFVMDCIELWKQALEAADTDRHTRNVERSMIQLYQMCADMGTRDQELATVLKTLITKYGLTKEYD